MFMAVPWPISLCFDFEYPLCDKMLLSEQRDSVKRKGMGLFFAYASCLPFVNGQKTSQVSAIE